MTTLLLYQHDPYLKRIQATIKGMEPEKTMIEIDQTIIYPGGGGQAADHGTINGSPITSIVQEGTQVNYQVNQDVFSDLKTGGEVLVEIDWDFRYKIMRLHTAQHILAAIVLNRFETRIAGNYIHPENSHLDFQIERNFTVDECREIQEEVNRIVASNLTVEITTLSLDEVKAVIDSDRIRMDRLPALPRLRTVIINKLDATACGGTHVRKTSEIGEFRIKKFKSKGRTRKRFYYDVLK